MNNRLVQSACGHSGKTTRFHAKCHAKAGLWAEYCPSENWVRLSCAKCSKEVGTLRLAKKEEVVSTNVDTCPQDATPASAGRAPGGKSI